MSMELDVNNFVSALKKAYDSTDEVPYYIYTDGEAYIYNEIIKKSISGETIYVSDIDFEAFDEEEIVCLIDDRGEEIYNDIYLVGNIIDTIEKSPALTAANRKFF